MRSRCLLAVCFAVSANAASAQCGAGTFGLGIDEEACSGWKHAFDPETNYVALDFRFTLGPKLQGGQPPASLLSALRGFAGDDKTVVLGVAPIIGEVKLPEQMLFSYNLTDGATRADSVVKTWFFTPYVLNSTGALSFELRLRSLSDPTFKAKDFAGGVAELATIGDPTKMLMSQDVKDSLSRSGAIIDTILRRVSGGANEASATLDMGGSEGVAMRKLRIYDAASPDDAIGSLTVKVAVRPSLSSLSFAFGDADRPADPPAPDVADEVLNLTLPAVASQSRTLVSALRGADDTFLPVSRLALKNVADADLRDACASLKDSLRRAFGLSRHDAIRGLAALLERHERHALLERDNAVCFSRAEWREIDAHDLFRPQQIAPDWWVVSRTAEEFATGLRVGMKDEYARKIADPVEIESDLDAPMVPGLSGRGPAPRGCAGMPRPHRPEPRRRVQSLGARLALGAVLLHTARRSPRPRARTGDRRHRGGNAGRSGEGGGAGPNAGPLLRGAGETGP